MTKPDRVGANEQAVRQFLAALEPSWRWLLVLGLRDLRVDAHRLGRLASADTGETGWEDESLLYGPVCLGLTAAAVNETAQHCEDLFALLTFLPDPTTFVRRVTSYSAGKVTGLSATLLRESQDAIRARFFVPSEQTFIAGLAGGSDPEAACAQVEEAVGRLVTLTRSVADWYQTYEFFHLQYKHGLKIPLRPFGPLPPATIASRKANVKAPLIAFTNEPLAKLLTRPPSQQTIMFPDPGPAQLENISQMVRERDLLRYQLSGPEVDLDDVAAMSWTIVRLVRIVSTNRLALTASAKDIGPQQFVLPGANRNETLEVVVALDSPVTLRSFQGNPHS